MTLWLKQLLSNSLIIFNFPPQKRGRQFTIFPAIAGPRQGGGNQYPIIKFSINKIKTKKFNYSI